MTISIHALLAESDHFVTLSALASKQFLSTLSLRRATRLEFCGTAQHTYFYPRSPCGERQANTRAERQEQHISIHALLAESDSRQFGEVYEQDTFLSTLSLRRATELLKLLYPGSTNFYPRSPCGERQPSKTRRLTNLIISIHALLAESDQIQATPSAM